MYRMFTTFPRLGAVCALALALACNKAPSAPTETDAAAPASGDAAADGSTLKVNAPTLKEPVSGVRLETRNPTMVVNNSVGRFVNRAFSYEFQLLDDSNNVIRTVILPQGSGTTSWAYGEDLERDTPYRWQARARLGNAVSPWSTRERFLTVFEKRAPNPSPGQRLPRPTWGQAIVARIAAQRPDLFFNSCQEHGGSWGFMDAAVDALRIEDSRFGYNCKRGNCNDPSLDVIAYNYSSDPDPGTSNVYIIDIIGSHCGTSPSVIWNDVTDITVQAGTIGRWTSRGRF